ncbi:hypothetical protein [Buttiauxella brennerae]|uniref:hypothetical protein n=1 Tax=Buttiauxella brennerae TaxID=82988 RepID=UPI00286F0588|nr:hypothetical protein [Buttiauxella brennerae]
MRELNITEVLEVSGAGVIADSMAQAGSDVGTFFDSVCHTDTSASAIATVGRNFGSAIENTITAIGNAGINAINSMFKWLKIA